MNLSAPVLVAAGGTGGHLFPAEALARALTARGVAVELVTDQRAAQYGGDFPARAIHQVASATPSGGSLFAQIKAVFKLLAGTMTALRLIRRIRPAVVVGFGGYPTVPPLFAAALLRVPTILHEQNAVIGRANHFLASRVDALATGFPVLKGLGPGVKAQTFHIGNPVRPSVIAAAKEPYPVASENMFRLLVTGGSQGARVMADIVPQAIALLSATARRGLTIVQQARSEDEARVKKAYADISVAADVLPFFSDLPARIASANLVIGRAGASTVAELSIIGRPAILVPLPHALDQDQAENAAYLAAPGAAIVVAQKDFTPQWLAAVLDEMRQDPAGLAQRAAAARSVGIADASDRLANLVLDIARGGKRK